MKVISEFSEVQDTIIEIKRERSLGFIPSFSVSSQIQFHHGFLYHSCTKKNKQHITLDTQQYCINMQKT